MRQLPSNSLAAAVRAHFGLTQAELAHYLGVAREQVAYVEAGQREFSLAAERRLRPLVLLLPPAPAPEAAAPAEPAPVALDGAALRRRWRRCHHQAAQVRYELENRESRATAPARAGAGWRSCAALLPDAAPAPPAAADDERTRRWLHALAAEVAAPPPLSATARALLAARLRGLEAELHELAGLLASAAAKAAENQK